MEWYEASKADPEHIMFLRYEDLLADAPASVKKIADFVGIETTPEIMEKVGEFLNEGVFFSLCFVLWAGV